MDNGPSVDCVGACDEPVLVDLIIERTHAGVARSLLPTLAVLLGVVGASTQINWRGVERWLRVGGGGLKAD